MPRITKTLIAGVEPSATREFIWDDQPPGFGLAIQPSGAMAFVFQYRNAQGRTRRMTLAKWGKLTPDEARKKAKQLAAKVADGEDPLEDRKAAKGEISVGELLDLYLASEGFAEKARSTRETDRGRINNHLRPLLGRKLAKALTAENIKRARRSIEEGKTARDEKSGWRARSIVKGGKGTARQAIRLLAAVYSWAMDEGLVSENPAKAVKTSGDGSRNIVMRDGDDYRRLFETLDKLENEKRIRPAAADIIRIIALTGARRDEIAGLEWREVDLSKGLITIPPERHKTGRRTNSPRVIGLPSPATEILSRYERGNPKELVFRPTREDERGREYPGSRKGAPSRVNVTKPWRRIRDEAALPAGIGLHGLRHSLATHMALQGAQAAQIMTVLGHKKLQTSQRYVHAAEDARASLADRATVFIQNSIRKTPDEQ